MRNFRGIVPIQFFINTNLPLKWALDEIFMTIFKFLYFAGGHLGFGPMSRVQLTQFRLFWAETFIRVWGLTATPGLSCRFSNTSHFNTEIIKYVYD